VHCAPLVQTLLKSSLHPMWRHDRSKNTWSSTNSVPLSIGPVPICSLTWSTVPWKFCGGGFGYEINAIALQVFPPTCARAVDANPATNANPFPEFARLRGLDNSGARLEGLVKAALADEGDEALDKAIADLGVANSADNDAAISVGSLSPAGRGRG
jgi:hypothetical protein